MNTTTVLYAEDEDNDAFFARRAFKQAEVANPLQIVRNGQQAVDYLAGTGGYADRNQFPMPCLLLLDIKMPLKSGLEVLKWVREQAALRTLLVVMFTSSAEERDVQIAYEFGANAYLVKPADTAAMEAMTRTLRDFWLKWNQPPPGGLTLRGAFPTRA